VIIFCQPDDNLDVTVRYTDGRSYLLTHRISMDQSHPLLCVKKGRDGIYSWDYEPGPELREWLGDKPLSISYQGSRVNFQMTHEDAALFRLFFG
jgi:hypothetical protein